MKPNFSLKSFFLIAALFASSLAQSQVVRPFSVYYQNNQKGGIVYISNVSVSCGSATGCAAAEAELPPAGTTQNNDFIQQYVDVDNDGTTFMSSSDSLNLPQCSNITYAGLFWGGSVNNATPNFANRDKVKIKANNGSYIEIQADSLVSNNSGSITYHCYKNITNIAQANGRFARYTVADLVTQTGTANRFGGWTLVVAYRNDLESLKNLTVFGGVANISTSFTPVQIDLTGFLTPPTGPVTLEMGVVAYDGDRGFLQDSLYFNGAGTYIPVSDALNPVRDIFNSTIENKGVENPFRLPLLHNTMGWDADIFAPNNTTKNFIGNNATSASLRLTTGNENYYAQVVTTAIDVFEPDIRIGNTTVDINGGLLNPGDTLEYRVTMQNLGSDEATNSFLIDTIPFNLDYVPGSIKVIAGPNQGSKTDAFGDDQADFDPVGNRVIVRVGTGANATTGGSVIDSPTGADSSTFTFRATVTQECIKLRCSGFVNSSASGVATGLLSGNTQANASNPSILDGNGCPIPGFTSTLLNLPPSCSLPPDTAFSSCPPFLFSSLATALPGYVYFNSGFNPIAVATSSATYFGIKTLTTGCTDTIALVITIFPSPAFTSITKTNPSCGLPNSGSIILNGVNPNDSIAFTVGAAHSNASPFVLVSSLIPANTFQNLTSGAYTIRLKNATSCTLDQTSILSPAANCAPTATDDSFSTNEDVVLNASVATNDGDLNGDPLTYTVLTSTTHGSFILNANGTFSYTPNLNYNGPDSLTYIVCDNGAPALCDTAQVVIAVIPVNDAPIAVDDAETIDEDNTLLSTVATNDSDLEGNSLEFAAFTNPLNGTLLLNTDGSYSYIPNLNFNGTDSFTYTVCDDGIPSQCDTGLVSITVNPINDTPLAVDDTLFGGINLVINGDVSINDSDDDGDPLTFSVITNPANGLLVFNPNGTFAYSPNFNFIGNDTIVYLVCDNGAPALCDTGLVLLGVNTVNLAPVAVDDSLFVTNEDTPLSGDVSPNDFDPNGDPVAYSVLTNVSNGTLVLNANGTFNYTPALNFNGIDSFAYLVCDNGAPALCDTALAIIKVDSVNDAPVAIDDAVFSGFNLAVSGNASSNDFDVDGDPLTFTMLVAPDSGSVVFNSNGTFTYTPNTNFIGNDTIVYTVCDNANPALCDTAIIVVGVNTINLSPVAANDNNLVTNEDTQLNGDVSTNDFDPNADTLTYSILNLASNGSVVINPNGTFTYTPNANYNGPDSFVYLVCDNGTPALCDSATVTITVLPVNDAPIALNDTSTTNSVTPLNGTVATNDSDVDGDPLSFSSSTTPLFGTILFNSNGTYTYTPNGTLGTDTIVYIVCDNGTPALCDTAILFITVTQGIVPPIAVDDSFSTNEDTQLIGDVSTNDLNGGNLVTISVLALPLNGTVVMNGAGVFTYTPAANYNGPDSFTYVICDFGLPPSCDTAVVSITVTPVNDAPVAVNDTVTTNQNVPVTASAAPNDFDVDGDPLSFSTVTLPLHGTIVFNSNGTFTYTPNTGYSGPDTLVYTVCDNGTPALCDTAIVIFNVVPVIVNQPPVGVDDTFTTLEDTQLNGNVSTNDSDPDGNLLTYALFITTPNGTLVLNLNGTFTYTPNFNFNGTDTFTYIVCDNGTPGLCDTAIVTITVTPVNDAPLAIDDVFNMNLNTPLTADVSLNDTDVENNTLTFSVLGSTGNGTLAFNTNGSFTYTPNAGFSGTDAFSYIVCDNGTPALCDTALVTITVIPGIPFPLVGVAKSVSTPVPQGNGVFAVTYSVIIKNYGFAIASNVQVTDDLSATFPPPATFSVVGISSSILFANSPNYNGKTDINLLEPQVNQLAPGASDTITIAVLVTPNGPGPFNNSAIASALASAPDSSVNGNNPDPNGDLNPNESGVTPLTFPTSSINQIGIAKTASVSDIKSDGTYDVTYTFDIKNMGNTLLTGIIVYDNLSITFPSPVSFSVISVTTNGGLTANPNYTGTGANTNLLSSQGSTIPAGITNTIELKINVNTNGTSGTYLNSAEAVGNGPGGATTKDISNNVRIDENLNGNPSDQGEDKPTPITLNGEITPVVIFIPEGFTPDGDAQNEFFVVTGISLYPENKLTIYNRWGNIVYQKIGYDNTWNGISDNGDGKVTQGTYYYILELNKDELEPRKGYIVIEY
jgi:gliding motility-associated-like protein/uncharacterized repeat protein (TIGR01451 family)